MLTIDGLTIEYSVVGTGEPILVMHGGHSNCREEFGYEVLVENSYMMITPSRPGYGGTSKEIGESLSLACEYYSKLLEHLHIDKVHLVAISAGGPSGIHFAATHPHQVQSLILQSAVTKEWLTPKDIEYKAAKVIFRPNVEKYTWKMISMMNNAFPSFIFQQMFPSFSKLKYKDATAKFHQNDVEAIRKMNNRQRSGEGFMIDLEQVNKVSEQELQAIKCPTLIMHSHHDGSVSLDHPYFAHEHISSSELSLLDTWGHLIWIGAAAGETNNRLLSFLKAQRLK